MKKLYVLAAAIAISSLSCAKHDGGDSGHGFRPFGSVRRVAERFIRSVPVSSSLEFGGTKNGQGTSNAILSSQEIASTDAKTSSMSSSEISGSSTGGFGLDSLASALGGEPSAVAEANSYGSGTVPTDPGLGSGSLRLNPDYYADVPSNATVGAGNLAHSICNFMASFFSYFGRCINGTTVDFATAFGASGCEAAVTDMLHANGVGDDVPAIVTASLDCVSTKLLTVACTGTSDLSPPIFTSLRSCGFYFVAH